MLFVFLNGPGEHEGRGERAPLECLGPKKTCPDRAGHGQLTQSKALGVAFLLTDESFQKALCSQVGVPSSSEDNVLPL